MVFKQGVVGDGEKKKVGKGGLYKEKRKERVSEGRLYEHGVGEERGSVVGQWGTRFWVNIDLLEEDARFS